MLRFDGLTAVITGAGRGLGEAHARLLAERGAAVVVNDLDDTDVAASIVAAGGRAVGVVGSVTDPAVRERLVSTAIAEYGGLDILVNNAGMGRPHLAAELVEAHLQLEFDVHVVAALMLASLAWPHLRSGGDGAVVFTTSTVGLVGQAGSVGYGAAKAALLGATTVLAAEGRTDGVRVNAIAPMARTRMAGEVFGALTPHLAPRHVAEVVAWLVHPSCPVSGRVLSAGGGRVAGISLTVGRGARVEGLDDVPATWASLEDDEQLTLATALDEMALIEQALGLSTATPITEEP